MAPPLVVHPHFHPRYTGATRHVESVVPALAGQFDARVMGRTLDGALPRIGWRELWRRARDEQVIWHAHRANELLWGLLLRALGRDVKLVFTRHSVGRPALFTRLLAGSAGEIVSVTPEVAEALRLPSRVVLHGVDLRRFAPPADRREAWARLGVGGRFGVGVIGRIRPTKGQGDFVEAMAPLLPRYPDWHAALIGLAKPRDRAFAERLHAKGGPMLHVAGERRDVETWYRGLTVVVNHSRQESFGLVRAEALACGCCLVTTRLNALDALIEDGRTGFLFAPGDVKELREILEMLLREPARAETVGKNAAEMARGQLGVEREAALLGEMYRSLLVESPAGEPRGSA